MKHVFVELTKDEKPRLISLRAIAYVESRKDIDDNEGTVVYFSAMEDDYITVDESYEKVVELISLVEARS